MRGVRLLLLCSLLIWSPMMTASLAASSRSDWVNDLRCGGYVIVFRHGATTSDQNTDAMGNPNANPVSNPAGCEAAAGERQLNEKGRAQAEAIPELHAPSMTRAILAIRKSKFRTSSANCFRPAGVMR